MINALRKVRKTGMRATKTGGRVMAVSLDMSSAFNSLP